MSDFGVGCSPKILISAQMQRGIALGIVAVIEEAHIRHGRIKSQDARQSAASHHQVSSCWPELEGVRAYVSVVSGGVVQQVENHEAKQRSCQCGLPPPAAVTA